MGWGRANTMSNVKQATITEDVLFSVGARRVWLTHAAGGHYSDDGTLALAVNKNYGVTQLKHLVNVS